MTKQIHKSIVIPRANNLIELITSGIYDSGYNAGYFSAFVDVQKFLKNSSSVQSHIHEMNNHPIEILNLSKRPYNCLKREGVNTLGQLLDYSIEELETIRSFGSGCVTEVSQKLKNIGLELRTGSRSDDD